MSPRAKAKPSPLAAASLHLRAAESIILLAAIDVFARLGLRAARVEDILKAAGIARRTFYKHFDNKEAVLAAIYDFATAQLLDTMRSAGATGGNALDGVRRGIDAYLEYHAANGALVAVLIEESLRADSPLAKRRVEFRRQLVALLDEAARRGRAAKHDPYYYVALVSAVEGVSLELASGPGSGREVARARRVLHDLLDRALGAGPAARAR